MRQLASLLVLLFVFTAFSGCIGGPSITWGDDYEVKNNQDGTGITVTNTLSSSTSNHLEGEDIRLESCENSTYSISGWLTQTKVFDQPQTSNKAITSWMILEMPYNDAQDVRPGSAYVQIAKPDDWASPTSAKATPMVDGVMGTEKPQDFPHNQWALLGIIPANENVFDAVIQMDSNQAVSLNGWILEDEYFTENQIQGCALEASSKGLTGHFVVTSLTYGDERVVSSSQAYVAGDIPFIGRGLYTTVLLISIVASGALYIYSRNQLLLNADSQAQTMLSEQQMRAGKAARHEAARHEARMEAVAKAKVEDFSGRPKKKSSGVSTFDVNAALAEEGPGANTSHYVAGSSVTVTDEAEAMDKMVSEMQKEQAFEQELQEKGLRNIIEDLPRGGRRSTGRSSRPVPTISEPKEAPMPKSRKTRKTKSVVEDVDEEVDPPERTIDSDVNDDGDFSDFSL